MAPLADRFDLPGDIAAGDEEAGPAEPDLQAGDGGLASHEVPVGGVDRRRTHAYQHLVVPDDRLDDLASITTDISGPAGATVALAHVFTEAEYDEAREDLKFDRDSEVTPDVTARRYVNIQTLVTEMEEADVEYTEHGRLAEEGAVGEGILALAEDIEADLIVIGGRRRSPSGKALFGSIAQNVLLNAPCPVTFVRED
jgi:nucleotide-binding universal stress UspA family protein